MNNLQNRTALSIIGEIEKSGLHNQFTWRQNGGVFTRLCDMETSHLVNCIKMVWNNSVPSVYRFRNGRLYNFNSFYTDAYFKCAITCMSITLSQRTNMTKSQIDILQTILKYLRQGVQPRNVTLQLTSEKWYER